MPTLELTQKELIVHLSFWERLACLRKECRIPLDCVRGATEDEGFKGAALGLRAPGTNIPGLITAGTFWKAGDRQFVFIKRGTSPVVIELTHQNWVRIIIGVTDPRAVVDQINRVIQRA